ncbi:MAG: hypothetical protein WA172_19840 [Terriglobales bacterium]
MKKPKNAQKKVSMDALKKRGEKLWCHGHGQVTTNPSFPTCLFQVSAFVNHCSSGGLVDPRREAAINK